MVSSTAVEPVEDLDEDEEEVWDDPPVDDEQPVGPAGGRERSWRLVVTLAVVAVVAVVAARWFGFGPFGGGDGPPAETGSGSSERVSFLLPQDVIDAIELSKAPGGLSSFGGIYARGPEVCNGLPPVTNEMLYGIAGGDGRLVCERTLQNGAQPCSLWAQVLVTDKGVIWGLTTDGRPGAIGGQQSIPVRVFWCDQTTGAPLPPAGGPPTTTAATAGPGGR